MGQTIVAVAAAALAAIGVTGTALVVGSQVLAFAITAAISVGLSMLFAPRPPQAKPEDMQAQVKQPAHPRSRHYGRVKLAGAWAFAEAKDSRFFKLLVLGLGQFDAIEEYWIEDEQVFIDGSGKVTTGHYDGKVYLYTRLGTDASTSYERLQEKFPAKWTADHRLRGLATLLIEMNDVDEEDMMKVYPNHINTNVRVVARASLVKRINTGTVGWSDNAADVIRDYMSHRDGMRLPAGFFETPMAAAMWSQAWARAAEDVTRKDGISVEDRYRIWGSYQLNERPADVLNRFLATCDGRLYPTPDGGIGLDIGTWAEPSVIIDADAVTSFSEFSRGKSILDTANTITATFLGVDQDYQTADAEPWVDEDDVSDRGEITSDLSLIHAPSHGQARRLMKLAAYRANPQWVGTIQCNLRGMAALGERFIRFRYPLFDIDEVFEVMDYRLIIGENAILQGVIMQIQAMPQAAYAWNGPVEEGTAPVFEKTDEGNVVPDPTGFAVTIRRRTMNGTIIPYGVLSFTRPPENRRIEARGKATADVEWIAILAAKDASEAQSFALADGTQYEFQIRHRSSSSGRASDWVTTAPITPTADETAPGVVTSPTATAGVGQATLTWVAPNSANYRGAVIYRNTSNTPGTATAVATEYGAPSTADSRVNTITPGIYWYWIASVNASGVQSAKVATVPASVGVTAGPNIAVNGTFDTDTGWTKAGTWTISGGVAHATAAGAGVSISQPLTFVVGTTYKITFTVSNRSLGSILARLAGGTNVSGTAAAANGTYTEYLTAATGNTTLAFVCVNSSNTLDLDDVTCNAM